VASVIKIKRSGSASGAPGTLKSGELAYTYSSGVNKLYFGKGDDGFGNATEVVQIGGQYFTDMLDHTPGVLTTSSAIIVDSSNKIDILNVDNITLNGNTISSTDSNGNLILVPNGSGKVSFYNQYTFPTTAGSTGQALVYDGSGGLIWAGVTTANTATNIAGGSTGSIPIQTGNGSTSFIPAGSSGQLLVSQGTTSSFISTSSIYVNRAVNADTWATARTVTFTGDTTGTFTIDGSADVTNVNLTIQPNSVALGTDTTGIYVASADVTGFGISGSANTEGSIFTVTSNATSTNVNSTLVFRDGSGNFSAGTITAALTGVATTATNLAGGTQYAVPYQTAAGTTNFVSTSTTGQVLTRTSNGVEWQTPVTTADTISLGSPTTGSLTDNNPAITSWTTSTKVVDAVDRLNEILGKLVPSVPPSYPNSQSLTITGPTNYRIAVAQGSQTTNGNTGVTVAAGTTVSTLRANTFSTPTITGSGPGDSGTLSVTRNGSLAVSKIFTVGNTTQTITATAVATTLNSPNITISGLSGTLAVGMAFRSGGSGAFGGLAINTTYYISAVSGTTVTLATDAGLTTPFSGTSTVSGSMAFSATSDNGTTTLNNTSIVISNNTSFPVGTPGFWEAFDAQVTGTSVPAGWNTVRASHSSAGATNTATWYYDSSGPGTPVVTAVSITTQTQSITNSSTIPHYNSNSVFTMTFTCTRLSGDMYPTSDTFVTGTAGGAFNAPASVTYAQAGISTPLAQNLFVASGSATVATTATITSGFGASNVGPTVTVANSYANGSLAFTTALGVTVLYKTGAVGSISVLDELSIFFNSAVGGSTTPAAFRVENPDGGTAADTPVFTAGSTVFNSTSSSLLVTDATVVGTGIGADALRHDVTNYSTGYLPVGPNLSTGRSGAQYFTFRFVRSGVSKFNITYITSTGIGGIWAAMPGTGGTSGTTSSLNKWLSLAIDNSLANGCALGGNLNTGGTGTQSYNISFGTLSSTNATNNEIWVRIRLNSGQSITALYLGASTV
jgi:hypothetical protein